jgi:hypothetical protein
MAMMARQVFLKNVAKLQQFAQNLGIYKYKTLRLNGFHRLVTAALVK